MTTATSDISDPGQMVVLLKQQRDGYRQLVELGEQQSQFIKTGQPEQLLDLLSKRQTLIDDMAKVGEQVAVYHQQWSSIAATLGDEAAAQVRGLVSEVEELLAAVIEQDEKDRVALESTTQQARGELNKTAAAPKALNAYKSAAQNAARFTDRQG